MRCVYILTRKLAARDWRYLLVGKNPLMHKKVPSTSLPQHTSRASLVSVEKNHVRYFLNTGVRHANVMLAVSVKKLLQWIIMFAYGNAFLSQPFSAVNNMPPVEYTSKACLFSATLF